MPTESLGNLEWNGKRKLKNKIPKRLRHRNKEINMKITEDITNNGPGEGNFIDIFIVFAEYLCLQTTNHSKIEKRNEKVPYP